MVDRSNGFRFYDSSINIWTETKDDRSLYHALFECLGRAGFSIKRRKDVPKSIRDRYHHAQKRDLQADLKVFGLHIKVEFYQDLVHENQYGGRHDFDKVRKMPFHVRLYFEATRRRIAEMLQQRGFSDATEYEPDNQFDLAKNTCFQRTYGKQHRYDYNIKDRDGIPMADGDLRYTRTWDGRLFRGQVYWDGNNMWNIVANSRLRYRCAAFELFARTDGEPRKLHPRGAQRLQGELGKAIKDHNYERAIVLRDVLGIKVAAA